MSYFYEDEDELHNTEIPTLSMSELLAMAPVIESRRLSSRDLEAVRIQDHRVPTISLHDQPIEFDHTLPHESFDFLEHMPMTFGEEWESDTFGSINDDRFFEITDYTLHQDDPIVTDEILAYDKLMKSTFTPQPISTSEDRKIKTAIVTPIFAELNDYFRTHIQPEHRVLIVGSGSGPDIQRVWIARGKNAKGLTIDCVERDPVFTNCDKAFRVIADNVPGTTYIMNSYEIPNTLNYDLVLAVNSLHYACEDSSGLTIRKTIQHLLTVLKPDGRIIGMMPSLAGYLTSGVSLYDGPGAGIYADRLEVISYHAQLGWKGMLHNITVGMEMFDYILPPEDLITLCYEENATAEVQHSRAIIEKHQSTIQKKWSHYKTRPEHRGFSVFTIMHKDDNNIFHAPPCRLPKFTEPSFHDFRPWRNTDPVSPLQCTSFPRNHGRHIKRSECQFLNRAPLWFVSDKMDGESGYMLLLPTASVVTTDDGMTIVGKGSGLKNIIYLQIEKVNTMIWVVELLAVDGITPSSWMQGAASLRDLQIKWECTWLGVKQWVPLTLESLNRQLKTKPKCYKSDGIVLQNGTSPPPKYVKSHLEVGHAYYFKNYEPTYYITYDIDVTVTRLLDFGMEGEESLAPNFALVNPPVEGLSPEDVSGTYEVRRIRGVYHKVRYRPNKAPNSKETLDRLSDAATYKDIRIALSAASIKEVIIIDLRVEHKWMRVHSAGWTKAQKVWYAATYPRELRFVDDDPPHHQRLLAKLERERIHCVAHLISGLYDVELTKEEYNGVFA
jgi:SAM-dependent methyltransferase